MGVVKISVFVALLFLAPADQSVCRASQYRDRRNPPRHYNYPDKYDYGFDPTPPNIRIGPGFKPGHYWRFGGWYYGQGGYSPRDLDNKGMLWLGYEITW